jgi:hypothetical protein
MAFASDSNVITQGEKRMRIALPNCSVVSSVTFYKGRPNPLLRLPAVGDNGEMLASLSTLDWVILAVVGVILIGNTLHDWWRPPPIRF